MTYRASQTIISASFSPMELARLKAAVTLHHMERIADPAFEAIWLDGISADEEAEWDLFATVCESARFGR